MSAKEADIGPGIKAVSASIGAIQDIAAGSVGGLICWDLANGIEVFVSSNTAQEIVSVRDSISDEALRSEIDSLIKAGPDEFSKLAKIAMKAPAQVYEPVAPAMAL